MRASPFLSRAALAAMGAALVAAGVTAPELPTVRAGSIERLLTPHVDVPRGLFAPDDTGSLCPAMLQQLLIAMDSSAVALGLDPGTVASVTLSNLNLTATNTGTTSANQGAHIPIANSHTTGKYYFEVTWTTIAGGNYGFGVGRTTFTYTDMGASGAGFCIFRSGNIWGGGVNSGKSLGTQSNGAIMGMAVDFTNHLGWVRRVSGTPSLWNNDAAADPATGTNGISFPSLAQIIFLTFGGTGGTSGNVQTLNGGASPYVLAAPSGFNNW